MKNLFKVVTVFAALALIIGSVLALGAAADGDELIVGGAEATATGIVVPTEPIVTDPVVNPTEPVVTEAEPTATEVEPTATATEANDYIYGDANGDGVVNMKDVLTVRKYLADMEVYIVLEAADCYTDDAVNTKDVLALRQFIANLIQELPVIPETPVTTAA